MTASDKSQVDKKNAASPIQGEHLLCHKRLSLWELIELSYSQGQSGRNTPFSFSFFPFFFFNFLIRDDDRKVGVEQGADPGISSERIVLLGQVNP